MNLKKWDIFHCLAVSSGLIAFHLSGNLIPVLITITFSAILLWVSQWDTISHFKPAGGYANLVTLFRFILIIMIAALSDVLPVKILGILFILPVSLDALDGYLARRMKQESEFGALFDLETDSLFVALTGLILVDKQIAGTWILPAVYMRYFYVLVLLSSRLYGQPEKRTRFGPAVAVFLFISLIAGFLLPETFAIPLLATASFAVVFSFAYSFVMLVSARQNH